ncbi:MAG: translation initiation factor IF-2 [Thermodesulfobacteriota bacterium]|nr:MAG: translation initiation factor IF-2 [Candidatus Dadabacteria bacterium]
MEKIKIKDLALEISVDIKDIISKCKDLSIVARSSSSSVASEDAEKIKSSFSNHKIDSTKSERDIVKRSGAKVTIRRKKASLKPKVEDKTLSLEVKKAATVEEVKKAATVEEVKEAGPADVQIEDTNEQVAEEPLKEEKDNTSVESKQQPATTESSFNQNKKKDSDTQKPKRKAKIKISKQEIIDEDAMDALKSAVKAKLPGTRKEFLVSNNFPKKLKPTKDSATLNGEETDEDSEGKKAKIKTNKIKIQEKILITLLASKLKVKLNEVIKKASELGLSLTFKDEIDSDDATIIASEFNFDVEVDSYNEIAVLSEGVVRKDSDIETRPPIITVMGHVDHGKTSLLDYIRKSKVADKEFGGITQSIGAYSVNFNEKELVFIDTPGHAAFSSMRSRGASLTDIVILVVAADDGVMPQTIEAINHAKSANVPVIVAVNKIDKPESNLEVVKTKLSEYGLSPEDWGGDTSFVPVSALNGTGIDELLELISLQAEVMELKANSVVPSSGYVLESFLDKGRGVVATIIPKEGRITKGDIILCGTSSGKVRALIDDKGVQLKTSGPSIPIEILGLNSVPDAGLQYSIVKNEKIAKEVIRNRVNAIHDEESFKKHTVDIDFINSNLDLGAIKELPVIIKADTQGSLDALVSSLFNFESVKCKPNLVHSGVGAINESDFSLAESTGSIILGFSSIIEPKVQKLLDKSEVRCENYKIIYEIIDRIKELLEGLLDPILEERIVGHAEIKEIFNLTKQGRVAGCSVTDGKAVRGHNIRVMRDDEQIFESTLSSLKRFKDDVKEVSNGFECGIGFDDTDDVKQGDIIEIFTFDKIAQKIEAK